MNRNPVLIWTLRVLRVAQLTLLLLFVIYFVSVQVNAVAYLTGRNHPVIGGTTPPVPLNSAGSAVVDIIVGLLIEAVAALIFLIVVAMLRAAIRER